METGLLFLLASSESEFIFSFKRFRDDLATLLYRLF